MNRKAIEIAYEGGQNHMSESNITKRNNIKGENVK